MAIASITGFEWWAVITACTSIGNILSPNPTCVMMTTMEADDISKGKRICYNDHEMNWTKLKTEK